MTERRFGFVQWEFAGRLGPDPGRYAVRRFAGDDVRQIVVIGGYETARRSRLPRARRDRARAASAPEPGPVDVTRATVIDAAPMYERDAAEAWLAAAAGERSETIVADALAVLNRAVAAIAWRRRTRCWPTPIPPGRSSPRVGYGLGEQVAEGDWESARELPHPRERRSRALSPQQRLAALLSGRDVALACEELALRARG